MVMIVMTQVQEHPVLDPVGVVAVQVNTMLLIVALREVEDQTTLQEWVLPLQFRTSLLP